MTANSLLYGLNFWWGILFSLSYRIHMLNYGYFYPQGLLQRGTKFEDLHHREPLKAHVKTHGSPHPPSHISRPHHAL